MADFSTQRRERVLAADRAHVWHPYTQMKTYREGPDPLVIARAEGPYLEDTAGRRYLDGNSSWWVSVLGHGHPTVKRRVVEQMEDLAHCSLAGITHEPAASLATRLVESTPAGLEHVFYSDDGSTAVEVALKMAFQYFQQNGQPKRTRFVSFQGGFHGETIGCVSVGGVSLFHKMYQPLLFDVLFCPSPADGPEALAAFRELMAEHGDSVAGVVIEPLVQGAAGMRMYSEAAFREIAAATKEAGAYLIADEVFVGFGRTGSMWACERAGVEPDFLCTSKGLSAGMLPFAATLTTGKVFDGFLGDAESGRTFYYGHSYCGNPLGCAAALAVLDVFEEEQVLAGVDLRAQRMAEGLEALAKLPAVESVRQTGLIGALDLQERGVGGYLDDAGWQVYYRALELGAYLRPLGNIVYFAPPVNIPLDDLERLLQIAETAIASL
ncbi:MAG: adenosylmethionine--8-amino-7-oxononanoate transaminase [Myxococcales bacterium]|nr:adenosylmethionine--8-amino-7-oxononanoate transaminase [Myxococcales bacterium]